MKLKNKKSLVPGIISFLLFSFLLPTLCLPADWSVKPIRLFLEKGAKSGSISVVNDGSADLTVRMEPFEWSQDSEGKDRYTETQDIVFFPKSLTLKKGEERLIRVGIKKPATAREKTYRLFIREVPSSAQGEKRPNVAVAIRFGVPIFVSPAKEEARGDIESISLTKGTLNMLLKNSGNLHFLISSISVEGKNSKGEKMYSSELQGWYLLSGASRAYSLQIPQEVCGDITELDVKVASDKLEFSGNLSIDREQCMP